jgi:hypothetical protein
MATPKAKTAPPGNVITNCNFNSEAFVVNEHVAVAIRALADAAAANARAIETCANRLVGPTDNRVSLRVESAK